MEGRTFERNGKTSREPPLWLREPPPDAERLAHALDALSRVSGVDPSVVMDPTTAYGRGSADARSSVPAVAERGRNWLWAAAALGSSEAAAELVHHITVVAPGRPGSPRSADLLALVGKWFAVASRGVQRRSAMPPLPSAGRSFQERFPDPSECEGWEVETPPDDVEEEDGLVVCPTIGDPASKEGRIIAQRFAHFIGVRLPFRGETPDPAAFSAAFVARFPWAESLARYLRGQFALRRRSMVKVPGLPPLLLVGPAGCGKSDMLRWISDFCGFPSMTIPVGGTNDGGGLSSVTRGWEGGRASAVVQRMADLGCANPCIILDELEKGVREGDGRNGSVTGTLLSMIQPPEDGYRDGYLLAPVDIRHVTFMASANSLSPLSLSLRGRFIVQAVPAPRPEHFDAILPGVVEAEARVRGVDIRMLPWITPGDREWLRAAFLRSHGDIRALVSAYRILSGDLAAEEDLVMRRPH